MYTLCTSLKLIICSILSVLCSISYAQAQKKTEQLVIIKDKELIVKPSASSSEADFDFLQGKWKVQNKMLKKRLDNNNEWIEFESTLHLTKVLTGLGNIENFYSSFNGNDFEGMAIRLFNSQTKLWKVYWVDINGCTMDEHPVTGSFQDGVGKFYTKDSFNGKEIIVLYQWDATDILHPKWSQAYSEDYGQTWEFNWYMVLTKNS